MRYEIKEGLGGYYSLTYAIIDTQRKNELGDDIVMCESDIEEDINNILNALNQWLKE